MAEYNCSTNPYPLRATNMKLAPVPAAMVALQDSVRLVLYTARHSLTGTVISRATALPGVEFHNQSRSSGMVRVLCGIGFQALARRILRTLLVVSLPAASAFAAENPLTVYTEDNFLHSRPVERDGELYVEGFASDLVRAVLQQAGFESEIVVLPWPRLMRSLETEPDTLAFMMTRTPDREDRFIWIGLIRPVSFKLWGLRERADELPRTLAGARHLRISSLRDDVVTNYLQEQGFTNLVYVRDSSNTINMLRRERLDLLPYNEPGIASYLAGHGEPSNALVPLISLDEISTGHYLVMNKDSNPELVEQIRSAFQSLLDNGEFERILGPSLAR